MSVWLSRRRLVLGAPSFAVLSATAQPLMSWAEAAKAQSPSVGGWREAVLIVPALEPWIEVLTTVGGWEIAHRGEPDASLNRLWSLTTEARTEQVLMRNVGTTTGLIRLVKVAGVQQRRIRPHDQSWETGGVQALDLRVLDMDATRAALEARGWRGPSDPVRYEAYRGIEVLQWAPSSPDGVRLSFIQRIAPPLTGWPELKRWARAGNAAITVKDMAASKSFFSDVLGLVVVGETDTVGGAGPNVMGLPWVFQRSLKTDIRAYNRGSGNESSIELIAMPQAQGRDYAQEAHPPNLGIAGLRFFVADASAVAARLAARGIAWAAPLQDLHLPPYGACRAFAVRAPDGVWLEFIQLA